MRSRLSGPAPVASLVLAVGMALGACGGQSTPARTVAPRSVASRASPALSPPGPTAPVVAVVDPVSIGMTADGSRRVCDDALAHAQTLAAQIKALKGVDAAQLTYDATLGKLDWIVLDVGTAAQWNGLMDAANPDDGGRKAAKECAPKVDAFQTSIYLDADIAAVIKAYAAKREALSTEKTRFLSDTLRDFHRNGLDLSPADQATLRDLNAKLIATGQQFDANVASSSGSIEVLPAQLDGMPKEWIAKHPADADGKVAVTVDYADYYPFVTYAKDRAAAKSLFVLFMNRGGDDNVGVLTQLLSLRDQKAKLLGYPTWADYAVEPRMAKTASNVRGFLHRVADAVREPAKAEYAELLSQHVALGGKPTDKLQAYDRFYLADRVRAKSYAFDSKELSEYFEVSAVIEGLLDITSKMYGIEYRSVPANAWHPDVTAYEVWSNGSELGKFFLDLYSRKDKFKHAAMFPIRQARKMEDGTRVFPLAALECNFPRPTGDPTSPALMTHSEVSTFFHEFGHVLHQMLTTSDLAIYSGSNAVQDFVEAPSQMFEEWVWQRDVLDLFASHYQTHQKIPDALFAAMTRARKFGRALETQRQIFLATLDFEYHSRSPGFDTTLVLEDVESRTDAFPWVPGTHFQSSFTHLNGYGAGYYGYQWALAISRDVLTRFATSGYLDTTTAAAWRDDVLSKGGGVDEATMLAQFLGRPSNDDAYFAYLRGN